MKLIIEMPDDLYESKLKIKNGIWHQNLTDIENAIANGKPLPKGHGRLIDVDNLRIDAHYIREDGDTAIYIPAFSLRQILKAPTIIEADREVENETDIINKEKASTAYWVKKKGGGENYYYYSCSKCACIAPNTETADGIIWKLSNYCPDCGRKMGVKNETKM